MELDLFVIGEDSPDPKKWSIWSEPCLVIAHNKEEARKFCTEDNPVTKIEFDEPKFLMSQSEPSWGKDI